MPEVLNISSLVVQARPEYMADVTKAIEQLPGAEIPVSDPMGKIVVVLELEGDRVLSERIDQIQKMAGVLSASLVYHHAEGASDAAAEVPLAPAQGSLK